MKYIENIKKKLNIVYWQYNNTLVIIMVFNKNLKILLTNMILYDNIISVISYHYFTLLFVCIMGSCNDFP
jgi:hypothetical protein